MSEEDETTKQTTKNYFYGLGRRKTAVARVRLLPGKGVLIVNNQNLEPESLIIEPLTLVGQDTKYDISAIVTGGGKYSRLEAIRLGVARALLQVDPNNRQSLRKAGFLTRDPREKERKKPGLKRARRAPQWAKR